ncbi:MAG: N-acetyltransferase [Burkholderiales bacterium]|nr:N-acetyltransferase [Burkholderiales bacterium]
MAEGDYVIRVHSSPLDVDANAWDALLHAQPGATPFMRHAYLAALHASGCATAATGWRPQFFTLELNKQLVAACAVYLKTHSYGEYVFDWAWANAYAQHGLDYYPKAVIAVPFTPVPGTRLLARTAQARDKLLTTLLQWCQERDLSSLHLLFESDADRQVCVQSGMLERHTVQFHWRNTTPGYGDFDAFFWDFFYRCYERTYLEHGNAPYLNRDFFARMADTMAQHWVLFIAERAGQSIASSLIAVDAHQTGANGRNDTISEHVAYGRYWGALERVDCLHFEACYYQPLQWCIANGYQRFEGGAQGEHKMARALLPVKTTSTHWLAHPAFADAVEQFLAQEKEGVNNYLRQLGDRSPFRNQG